MGGGGRAGWRLMGGRVEGRRRKRKGRKGIGSEKGMIQSYLNICLGFNRSDVEEKYLLPVDNSNRD